MCPVTGPFPPSPPMWPKVQSELRRMGRSLSLKRYVGRDYKLHAASTSHNGAESSAQFPRSFRAPSILQTETSMLWEWGRLARPLWLWEFSQFFIFFLQILQPDKWGGTIGINRFKLRNNETSPYRAAGGSKGLHDDPVSGLRVHQYGTAPHQTPPGGRLQCYFIFIIYVKCKQLHKPLTCGFLLFFLTTNRFMASKIIQTWLIWI